MSKNKLVEQIIIELQKCNDIELLDLILRLLDKSI
jgi:hypothetical protein